MSSAAIFAAIPNAPADVQPILFRQGQVALANEHVAACPNCAGAVLGEPSPVMVHLTYTTTAYTHIPVASIHGEFCDAHLSEVLEVHNPWLILTDVLTNPYGWVETHPMHWRYFHHADREELMPGRIAFILERGLPDVDTSPDFKPAFFGPHLTEQDRHYANADYKRHGCAVLRTAEGTEFLLVRDRTISPPVKYQDLPRVTGKEYAVIGEDELEAVLMVKAVIPDAEVVL